MLANRLTPCTPVSAASSPNSRVRNVFPRVAGRLLLLSLSVGAAHGQAVNFAGQLISFGSGFSYPQGVAVDAKGDVYVADSANNAIKEIVAVNGVIPPVNPTIYTLGSGFSSPGGVAVDSSGDVFVADTNNGQVKEIIAINGAVPPTGAVVKNLAGNTFVAPTGVAIDSHGNVFVADIALYEIPASSFYTSAVILGSSYDFEPQGVAVDASGNVYDADLDGAVWELVAAKNFNSVKKLAGGLTAPLGVAVDKSGNVYFTQSGTAAMEEIEAVGGTIPSNPTIVTISMGSEFSYVYGVGVDSSGHVFVTNVGNNTIVKLFKESVVYYGSVNTCPAGEEPDASCSNPLTLSYNVSTSGTLGTPRVLTTGQPYLDFTLGAGNTCTGTVTAGISCAVNVTFTPLAPGLRRGAVQIVSGTGTVLATTYVYGIGVGPAVSYLPGIPSSYVSGFTKPWGAVTDALGNVYIADLGASSIVEIPAGTTSLKTIATGLNQPMQLAVDGVGNLYVGSDGASSSVVVIPAGCTASSCRQSVGSGFSAAGGVAVDGFGDLFVSDFLQGKVVEVPPGCTASACQITIASGIVNGYAMAIDAGGDLFVAQASTAGIVEIPSGCTTASCRITVGSGFLGPTGVAVDAAGDVFVADPPSHNAYEVTPAGARIQLPCPANPQGIAEDPFGDVFIPGQSMTPTGQVKVLNRSQAPSLAFVSTPVGSTSSAQSVTIQNFGNANLDGASLSISPNWEQAGSSGSIETCTAGITLPAGGECNLSISFDPQTSGTLSGAATMQNNALNGEPATQSVALSGTATGKSQTISFSPIASQIVNANMPLAATASSGLTVSFASTTPSICTVSGTTANLVRVGTCSIAASQAGNNVYAAAAPVTRSFAVAQ
jgi:large repetitive protein